MLLRLIPLLFLSLTAQASQLHPGMTMQEVRKELGPPSEEIKESHQTVWYYPRWSNLPGTKKRFCKNTIYKYCVLYFSPKGKLGTQERIREDYLDPDSQWAEVED